MTNTYDCMKLCNNSVLNMIVVISNLFIFIPVIRQKN